MKHFAAAFLVLASFVPTAFAQDWKAEWDRTIAAAEQEGSSTRSGANARAGRYLWDVAAAGPNPVYALYKDGAVDPILPEFILPEVKDEAAWGGWDQALIDLQHRYVFSMSAYISSPFYNAAFLPREKVQQMGLKILLDPAYKGKIAWQDPATPGSGHSFALDLRLISAMTD
jgi:hypothetical protein